MTTTQLSHTFTRWVTAPFRAFWDAQEEPAAAGDAIAWSDRFPQAQLAEAKRAAWA